MSDDGFSDGDLDEFEESRDDPSSKKKVNDICKYE